MVWLRTAGSVSGRKYLLTPFHALKFPSPQTMVIETLADNTLHEVSISSLPLQAILGDAKPADMGVLRQWFVNTWSSLFRPAVSYSHDFSIVNLTESEFSEKHWVFDLLLPVRQIHSQSPTGGKFAFVRMHAVLGESVDIQADSSLFPRLETDDKPAFYVSGKRLYAITGASILGCNARTKRWAVLKPLSGDPCLWADTAVINGKCLFVIICKAANESVLALVFNNNVLECESLITGLAVESVLHFIAYNDELLWIFGDGSMSRHKIKASNYGIELEPVAPIKLIKKHFIKVFATKVPELVLFLVDSEDVLTAHMQGQVVTQAKLPQPAANIIDHSICANLQLFLLFSDGTVYAFAGVSLMIQGQNCTPCGFEFSRWFDLLSPFPGIAVGKPAIDGEVCRAIELQFDLKTGSFPPADWASLRNAKPNSPIFWQLILDLLSPDPAGNPLAQKLSKEMGFNGHELRMKTALYKMVKGEEAAHVFCDGRVFRLLSDSFVEWMMESLPMSSTARSILQIFSDERKAACATAENAVVANCSPVSSSRKVFLSPNLSSPRLFHSSPILPPRHHPPKTPTRLSSLTFEDQIVIPNTPTGQNPFRDQLGEASRSLENVALGLKRLSSDSFDRHLFIDKLKRRKTAKARTLKRRKFE